MYSLFAAASVAPVMEEGSAASSGSGSGSGDLERVTSITVNTTTRVCRDDFYLDEEINLCLPECGEWEEFSHTYVVIVDGIIIMTAVIFFATSAILITVSCIRYNRM